MSSLEGTKLVASTETLKCTSRILDRKEWTGAEERRLKFDKGKRADFVDVISVRAYNETASVLKKRRK